MQTRVLIVLVAVAVALTGCASPNFGGIYPAPVSVDSGYVSAVRVIAPSLTETDNETLIDSGKGVCSQLVKGRSADELFDRAVEAGLAPDEGEAIIASAIDSYCPEQVWIGNP